MPFRRLSVLSRRREFLSFLTAAASSATIGTSAFGSERQVPAQAAQAASPAIDPEAIGFWAKQFLQPPSGTLGPPGAADARTPRFFVYTQPNGFRVPTAPPVKVEELEKLQRPSLRLRVTALKPSNDEGRKFDTSQSGTLRVDVLESGMMNAGKPDANASTSVSGLAVSGQAKLQPSSINGTVIGGPQGIALPDGGGYLNWAFFLQQKEAVWHQVLAEFMSLSKSVAGAYMPVFNLAKVPKESWTGFNTVLGGMFPAPNSNQTGAKSTFWMFTPTLVSVAASQSAFQDPAFADGLPLIKGAYYTVVPQEHYERFGNAMSKMTLAQGYVVPAQTPAQSVFKAAYETPELKDVSYITLHCEEITETQEKPCGASAKTDVLKP
jgi:hypothetical protein